jgi:hypothetical protein
MPDPVVQVIAEELVGHTIDLMRYDAHLRQQVLEALVHLQNDLVEKLQKYDPTSARTETGRIARLRQLLADVNRTIDRAYTDASDRHADGLFGVVQVEGEYAATMINALVGADLIASRLDTRTMRSLASDTTIMGAPASEWWDRQGENLKKRYADQVRLGLYQNEDMSGLLQRTRGTFTGKYFTVEDTDGVKRREPQFVNGVMDASTREATALIRTSVQSVANASRLSLYEDNLDVIKGVQALVTLDERTTPLCRGRSGFSWSLPDGDPLEGTPIPFPGPPPWHFQCRSTLIPVLRSWEELSGGRSKISTRRFNDLESKIAPRMQSSMDGQVAGNLTYEDWLSKQSKERQLEVLGPNRYKLWADGKLGLTDMVDQTGRSLTLDELRSRSNG